MTCYTYQRVARGHYELVNPVGRVYDTLHGNERDAKEAIRFNNWVLWWTGGW